MLKDARDAGIAVRTLYRAKPKLGVRSEREADGSWTWVLPKDGEQEEGGQPPDHDDLGNLGNLGGESVTDEGEGLGCQDGQDGQRRHDSSQSGDEDDPPSGGRGPAGAPSGGTAPAPRQPDGEDAAGRDSVRVATSEVEVALRTWAAEDPDILTDDPASVADMLSYSKRLDCEPDINEVAEALRRVVDGGVIPSETVAAPGRRVA